MSSPRLAPVADSITSASGGGCIIPAAECDPRGLLFDDRLPAPGRFARLLRAQLPLRLPALKPAHARRAVRFAAPARVGARALLHVRHRSPRETSLGRVRAARRDR